MSSSRPTKRRAHDGKIEYASRKLALAALREIRQNHPTWGLMLPYRCPFGRTAVGHYHLGHPPRTRKKRRRKSLRP